MHQENKRFDPAKLDKLNDTERLKIFPVEEIIALSSIKDPDVIIDLGAGTAFFSKPLASLFKNCRIYACDILEIMVEWMKKNVVPEYPNIIPVKINDNEIPLEDDIADFVFMVNLHHELDKPMDTLLECKRLLKPGGVLAISDWKKEETEHGPPQGIRYEPQEVKMQLIGAGYSDIKVSMDFPNNFLLIASKK